MDVWERWLLLKEVVTSHMRHAPPTLRVLPNFEQQCYQGVLESMEHLAAREGEELAADAEHLATYAKVHGSKGGA